MKIKANWFYFLHKCYLLSGRLYRKNSSIRCRKPNCDLPCFTKSDIVINIITVIIITIIIVIQTVQLFTMLFFLNQGWLTSTTSPTSTIALLRDFQAWRHCKLLFWFFISVIPLDWLTHSLINKLPLGFYLSIYYVIQSYYVYNPFLNRFCV